jgi:hypothetical protein
LAREFRQRARLRSIKDQALDDPLSLITSEITETKELLDVAEREKGPNRTRVDQLKNRLIRLVSAERELNPAAHTENQLIFRDAIAAGDGLPQIGTGQAYRDFELPDGNTLRVRVLHPDKPEHVTGADIIYERHEPELRSASIVAVQYKVWDKKTLPLSEARMMKQLSRLKVFLCDSGACMPSPEEDTYRFPFCAAFLKPCDKLQNADQKLLSSGEHIPLCRIEEIKTKTKRGVPNLESEKVLKTSLNSAMFEILFTRGKIGSRHISYPDLKKLYADNLVSLSEDSVVVQSQEFRAQIAS